MEFFLELALTITLPLLISLILSKFLSRGSTDEELPPVALDFGFGFGSKICNMESDGEIVECEPKQGISISTVVLESGDETESDSDNCEVADKVFDESSVRATRCEEATGVNRDEEGDGVEAFGSDRSEEAGGVNDGGSAEEIAVEDDDWEGIERTGLEKLFEAAVGFVKIRDIEDPNFLGGELKMRLSGLHKIAMEGPCREPPPMALKISARAKWNAWKQMGNMTPEVAMESYINLVSENIPGWTPKTPPVSIRFYHEHVVSY